MKILLQLLLSASFVLPACADTTASAFTGYLVDRDSVRRLNNKLDLELTRAAYDRNKALQSKLGFGVISNGQLYELDTSGNRFARSLITNSHNDQPLMVMIRGRLMTSTIAVEKLSDISVQQF